MKILVNGCALMWTLTLSALVAALLTLAIAVMLSAAAAVAILLFAQILPVLV